jgi:hypothetical protein
MGTVRKKDSIRQAARGAAGIQYGQMAVRLFLVILLRERLSPVPEDEAKPGPTVY